MGYGMMDSHPYIASGLYAAALVQISVGFWLWSKWRKRIRVLPVLAVLLVFSFFEYHWLWHLHVYRHTLSTKERAIFETPLRAKKDATLDIQIACPLNDEHTCSYATQFISLFGESGWKVSPFIQRIMLSKSISGIHIRKRGGNKEWMMQHWDAGAYFAFNEPHVVAIYDAFRAIAIETEGSTDPDLGEQVIMLYFGPERDNESETTDLTEDIEWWRNGAKGPLPKHDRSFR